jgi:hypothetical protein
MLEHPADDANGRLIPVEASAAYQINVHLRALKGC